MLIELLDKNSNIIIKEKTYLKLIYFKTNRFNSLSNNRKKFLIQEILHSLAFDNKLPISGSDIKNWDYNAYVSEKEGFAINKDDFKTTPSLANFYKNYEILDTILHEFYHRYTTYHKDKQTDNFKLNLDGYFSPGDLIYYTQPTEIGARQFSIRMLTKLNEYFCDNNLDKFINLQKEKFNEENRNEYLGIKKEGYEKFVDKLYEFKARENIIDKSNLQKYIKISENNLNYYLDSYQDTLSIAIEEYNLNTDESLFLCATCKNNTLYINNFYGPESDKDYVLKFKSFEKKLEYIAKYYEKQTRNVITKLEISPFFQGLKRNERNKIVSNFTHSIDNVNNISFLNKENFNIKIINEDKFLEDKIYNYKDNVKFASILNRFETIDGIDNSSIEYLKNKLINEFNFDKNITNEETRKIFKYFVFSTNSIEERLNNKLLNDAINNYFVLKNSNKLDEVIAENIIIDEKEFDKHINLFELEK